MDERRWLQISVCIACIVPIGAGLAGSVFGASFLAWLDDTTLTGFALDSHVRYLSGLLLAIGLAFVGAVPTIEHQSSRFKLLTFIVFIGGLMRFARLGVSGLPPKGMMFGLVMELAITPLLCAWQLRVSNKIKKNARLKDRIFGF